MATAPARFITPLLTTATKRSSGPAFRPSYTCLSLFNSLSPPAPTNFRLLHLRYLTAASLRLLTPAHSTAVRAFATMQISSSLNDPIPKLSNQPLEETILKDDGCNVERWIIELDEPEGSPTRDEIIDNYIKILAVFVGSEEEARRKIFYVSTRHFFRFGAAVSKEIAFKMMYMFRVPLVGVDSVMHVVCGGAGEPFNNGQIVPYDLNYHKAFIKEELTSRFQIEDEDSESEGEEEESWL